MRVMTVTMKTSLIAATFVCCMTYALAQNPKGQCSVRPMAGINIASFSGNVADLYYPKVRLTGGIEVEYAATDWLGLSLGAMYSQQGARADGKMYGGIVTDDVAKNYTVFQTSGNYELIVSVDGNVYSDYINFPLLANIYIPQLEGLALKVGVQWGALVNDKLKAHMEGVLIQNGNHLELPFSLDTERSNIIKSADFGIPVGLSYEYKNVVLDARYYFGLTKVDATVDNENVRNRYLSFTLGYRLHL